MLSLSLAGCTENELDDELPHPVVALAPYIFVSDVEATAEFARNVLGGDIILKMEHEGELAHAEVAINGFHLHIGKVRAEETPATVSLYVRDARAIHDAAVQWGAQSILEPRLVARGDAGEHDDWLRSGVQDVDGHTWWFTQRPDLS